MSEEFFKFMMDELIKFYEEDALYWARQNNSYLAQRYENYVRILSALRNLDYGNAYKIRAFITKESEKWEQDPIMILTQS